MEMPKSRHTGPFKYGGQRAKKEARGLRKRPLALSKYMSERITSRRT